jgi:hypothetical protein
VAIERTVGYSVGMTRPRLILAICVAVIALGAAGWMVGDGLSPEERRLVGTWRTSGNLSGVDEEVQYSRNHRVRLRVGSGNLKDYGRSRF